MTSSISVPNPADVYHGFVPDLPNEEDLQNFSLLNPTLLPPPTRTAAEQQEQQQQQRQYDSRRAMLSASQKAPPHLDVFICKSHNLTSDRGGGGDLNEGDTVTIPDLSHIVGCRTHLLDNEWIGKNLKSAVDKIYPADEQYATRTVEKQVERESAAFVKGARSKKGRVEGERMKWEGKVTNKVNELIRSKR